ncbi:hypothetical protein [Bacillus safensis]|uniref:hypothetical protein n=1 Tax=Bacillus safensis TaxID=561879 RepID=UPI003C13D54B
MKVKVGKAIKLNEIPLDGYREVVWNTNDEFNHHSVKIKGFGGQSVTLYNDEIDKLYEFLSGVISYK